MKYQAPYGSVDPNAPYVDRNTPGAERGSVPPAAAIEDPQRELVNLLTAAGVTPSDANLQQLAVAIRSLRLNLVTAGGTANALTGALSIAPANYAAITHMPVLLLTGASPNSGAATLNLNGLGTKPIVRMDGADLQPGDLPASSYVILIYDGAEFRNLLAGGPNAQTSGQEIWSVAGTYSWTVPAGVSRVLAEVWGAGGGGGGANSGSVASAGAGGGGGGYARKYFSVTPGQIIPIIIGAGGTRGISGVIHGGAGGDSSIDGSLVAPGGAGGLSAQDAFAAGGTAGGVPTTGDVNITGNAGGGGIDTGVSPVSGAGGGAFGFPGWGSGNQGTPGSTGPQPGTGGNGGASAVGLGITIGGYGADGYVMITF